MAITRPARSRERRRKGVSMRGGHDFWTRLFSSSSLVRTHRSAARAAPPCHRGTRPPLVRQLVPFLWRNIRDLAKNALVQPPAAALGPSEVVFSHQGGQLLPHGGTDELVHRHALSLGELPQVTVEGVGKTNTKRAHLRTPRPDRKGPGCRTVTPNVSVPTKSRTL